MRFYMVEGHDVAAFPEPLYRRLRQSVPSQYEIVAAHQCADGRLIAWCRQPHKDDLLKFVEGMVIGSA